MNPPSHAPRRRARPGCSASHAPGRWRVRRVTMFPRLFKTYLCICFGFVLWGCKSPDSRHDASVCEIHHCKMTIQELDCVLAQKVRSNTFQEGLRTRFPHYGPYRLIDEREIDLKTVRVYVCPECTKAYQEFEVWWRKQ
jgi:hypothetical protein